MRKLVVCDIEEFGRLESSEKTIAILGDMWWQQTAKQDGDRINKNSFYGIYGRSAMSAHMLEVSIRSRNGAPVSKGMRGQWPNDKGKQQMSPPLPPGA